jgi:hypothetical protein
LYRPHSVLCLPEHRFQAARACRIGPGRPKSRPPGGDRLDAPNKGARMMIKVKTFTNELKPMHAMKALADLDAQVNDFIAAKNVTDVVSVTDTCTTANGDTIGIIRALTYLTND